MNICKLCLARRKNSFSRTFVEQISVTLLPSMHRSSNRRPRTTDRVARGTRHTWCGLTRSLSADGVHNLWLGNFISIHEPRTLSLLLVALVTQYICQCDDRKASVAKDISLYPCTRHRWNPHRKSGRPNAACLHIGVLLSLPSSATNLSPQANHLVNLHSSTISPA